MDAVGGDDRICVGDGNDAVYAGSGDHRFLGRRDRDRMPGGSGGDLYGEQSPDVLSGLDGDD